MQSIGHAWVLRVQYWLGDRSYESYSDRIPISQRDCGTNDAAWVYG
jgi:hypothetical protein